MSGGLLSEIVKNTGSSAHIGVDKSTEKTIAGGRHGPVKTALLKHFHLRERFPEGGVPVKGGSRLRGRAPLPALYGVPGGKIIPRRKCFSWVSFL